MSTNNIGFYEILTKKIFQLSSNMHLISSSDHTWKEDNSKILCVRLGTLEQLHYHLRLLRYIPPVCNEDFLSSFLQCISHSLEIGGTIHKPDNKQGYTAFEPCREKTWVSDQVRHKLGCIATEDG